MGWSLNGSCGLMLHPDYPVVSGPYRLTTDWSVDLPSEVNRRVEDGSMVLWRPGLTAWISIWGNDHDRSPREQIEWLREDVSPDATEVDVRIDRTPALLSYRVDETRPEGVVLGCYGFAASSDGYVQIAIYLDDEGDLAEASSIIESLSPAAA